MPGKSEVALSFAELFEWLEGADVQSVDSPAVAAQTAGSNFEGVHRGKLERRRAESCQP